MKQLKIAVLGLLLALVLIMSPVYAATNGEQLRIMTFNIRADEGTGPQDQWEIRRVRQIELIEEHQPDVIGFQEVLKEQFDFLIDSLANYSSVGEGLQGGMTKEHNAIFFRKDKYYLREAGTFVLPVIPDRVTWVRLSDRNGKEFYVLNTHLHQRSDDPRAWNTLLEKAHEFLESGRGPVFLMGDMNERAGVSTGWTILNRQENAESFRDAWLFAQDRVGPVRSSGFEGRTESFDPLDWVSRIDWILLMGEANPITIETITSDRYDGRYSSDHRAVQAVFDFVEPTYEPPELAEVRLDYMTIRVLEEEIFIGDMFTVEVQVRNLGGVGRGDVVLLLNEEVSDISSGFFNVAEEKTLEFQFQLYQAGSYEVAVEGGPSIVVDVLQRSLF